MCVHRRTCGEQEVQAVCLAYAGPALSPRNLLRLLFVPDEGPATWQPLGQEQSLGLPAASPEVAVLPTSGEMQGNTKEPLPKARHPGVECSWPPGSGDLECSWQGPWQPVW